MVVQAEYVSTLPLTAAQQDTAALVAAHLRKLAAGGGAS